MTIHDKKTISKCTQVSLYVLAWIESTPSNAVNKDSALHAIWMLYFRRFIKHDKHVEHL